MTRFLPVKLFLSTLLLVAAPVMHAQDGVEGALARINPTPSVRNPLGSLFNPTLAIADFDNDNKLDGAVLTESASSPGSGSFEIEFHFTALSNRNIRLWLPESDITVSAIDVDHDGDVDIVIEQSLTHKGLQVWLNDGHGNFQKGRIEDFPSAAPARDQLTSSDCSDCPADSLATQRSFETLLMSCHIAGRPPSDIELASAPSNSFQLDTPFSFATSRAPPLSYCPS